MRDSHARVSQADRKRDLSHTKGRSKTDPEEARCTSARPSKTSMRPSAQKVRDSSNIDNLSNFQPMNMTSNRWALQGSVNIGTEANLMSYIAAGGHAGGVGDMSSMRILE